MISREYLERLELTEDQITLLMDAMSKESRYRQILSQERVSPSVIEPIMRTVDLEKVDFSNEDLLREKIRIEWADMMPKKSENVQIWANKK